VLCAAVVELDPTTKKTNKITRLRLFE
jgi:hypothetical protein